MDVPYTNISESLNLYTGIIKTDNIIDIRYNDRIYTYLQ